MPKEGAEELQALPLGDQTPSTKKRSLRRFIIPVGILIVASVVAFWFWSRHRQRAHTYAGPLITPARQIDDFVLTDHQGRRLRLSEHLNTLNLIYFGYTYCPDVCPMTLADMVKVKRALKAQASAVTFFMITVDPERDTPEMLKRRLAAFDPSFIGLTGDRAMLQPIWDDFGVYAQREKPAGSSTAYLVAHTSYLYLLDRHRRLRLLFAFGTPPQEITKDIAYILQTTPRR